MDRLPVHRCRYRDRNTLRDLVLGWRIIAAAERLGASILYAEDLNHGQRYGSVQAINPFLPRTPDGVHDDRNAGYA